jgi:hypothetical protein
MSSHKIACNAHLGPQDTCWIDKDGKKTTVTINPFPDQTDHPQNRHRCGTRSPKDYGNNEYDHTSQTFKMGGHVTAKGFSQYSYKMTYIEDSMSGPIITLTCLERKLPKRKKVQEKWENPTAYDWSMDRDTYFKLLDYFARNF